MMKNRLNPLLRAASLIATCSISFPSTAHAAIWQWDGGATTGNWQTAANWNPDASNLRFNGTFADRLNVNGAQRLIYTSAEGTTNYTGDNTPTTGGGRGLTVGNGTTGTFEITGGTFSTLGAIAQDVIGNGNNSTGTLIVNGGNFIGTNAGTSMGIGTGAGRVSNLNVQSGNATFATITMNSSSATINLSGGVLAVNNITKAAGSTASINFTGGTLKARQNNTAFLTGLDTVRISANTLTVDTDGSNITIGQALLAGTSGSGGLDKVGSGILTLSGSNAYFGATNVTTGTLNLTGSLASAITVKSGATLTGEGSTTGNVIFEAGSIFTFDPSTISANQFFRTTGTINTTAGAADKIRINLSSPVSSGSGIVVMEGSSIITNGASDFLLTSRGNLTTTSTQVLFDYTAGSIVWKGGNGTNPSFWDINTTPLNFTNGGVDDFFFNLDNVTFNDTASSYNVAIQGTSVTPGSITFNNSTEYTLSGGAIAGSGSITKNGPGVVNLNNANTFTGITTVNAGTLRAGTTTAFGPAASARIAFGSGSTGTVQLNGNSTTLISLTTDLTTPGTPVLENASASAATLTVNAATSSTFAGILRNGSGGGALSLTKTGTGILTLSGNNSHSGLTTISAGAILRTSADSGSGNISVANEATLALSGTFTAGSGQTLTLNGPGSNSAGYFYTGSAIQRGSLQVLSGTATWAGSIVVGATTNTRIGVQDGASLILSGGISGSNPLFRAGNAGSNITLTGTGLWTGSTQIFSNGGFIRVGANNAFPVGTSLVVNSGGSTILDLNGLNQQFAGIGGSAFDGAGTILNSAANTTSVLTSAVAADSSAIYYAVIADGAGKTQLVKSGAGSQVLQGASTYTGGTWIRDGAIIIQRDDNRLPTVGTVTLGDTATSGKLVIGETATTRSQTLAGLTATGLGGNVVGAHTTNNSTLTLNIASGTNSFGGIIGGATTNENNLSLNKQGAGTLELTNTNTYTGPTSITNGTLRVTGSIENSAVTVSNAGTTIASGSTGTLGKSVTVNASAILAPGGINTIGSASVGSNGLTMGANSIFAWDINANSNTSGFDQINVAGNVSIAATAIFRVIVGSTVNFSDSFWSSNRTWNNILNVTGGTTTSGWADTAALIYNSSGNLVPNVSNFGSFSVTGTTLTWSAVPEPSSALAGLLLASGLLRRRRSN